MTFSSLFYPLEGAASVICHAGISIDKSRRGGQEFLFLGDGKDTAKVPKRLYDAGQKFFELSKGSASLKLNESASWSFVYENLKCKKRGELSGSPLTHPLLVLLRIASPCGSQMRSLY